MIASTPSASSRSLKLWATGCNQLSQVAARTAAIPSTSQPMMSRWFSTRRSTIRNSVHSTIATAPGSIDFIVSLPGAAMSHSLAQLLRYQAGRAPRHQRDHHRKREHVLVGAGERQRDRADRLQRREQEAAENGAVDTSESADDGGAESHHAQIKAKAEIYFVVVEAVHEPGDSRQRRADGEGDEHNGVEVHPHGFGNLFVLGHGADRQPKLGALEQQLQADDDQNAGHEENRVVEP